MGWTSAVKARNPFTESRLSLVDGSNLAEGYADRIAVAIFDAVDAF